MSSSNSNTSPRHFSYTDRERNIFKDNHTNKRTCHTNSHWDTTSPMDMTHTITNNNNNTHHIKTSNLTHHMPTPCTNTRLRITTTI